MFFRAYTEQSLCSESNGQIYSSAAMNDDMFVETEPMAARAVMRDTTIMHQKIVEGIFTYYSDIVVINSMHSFNASWEILDLTLPKVLEHCV